MSYASSMSRQKSWQTSRRRVSVLAEMALRKEQLASRLEGLRESNGLTQEQAAARVGVTLRQWQRWEAGESVPYPRNLDGIASKFGLTVGEFFDETPRAQIVDRLDDLEARVDELTKRLAQVELERELAETSARKRRPAGGSAAAKPRRRAEG